MNEQFQQRLSDTRGNKRGVEFFRFWYKTWGYTHTKVMVWFVTFFYMLFDAEARRRVAPYIRHRFPDAGFLAQCKHTWFIFAHQGMCLLRQEMYEEMGEEYEVIYESALAEKIRYSDHAAVLLYSHFGPWQVMMRGIGKHRNTVNIVAQPDLNSKVDKMKSFSGENDTDCIRQVSPESGSLLFLQQALENDEFVTMMGDRNFEKNYSAQGCLYAREEADILKPSDNITIYGHTMKDGSMFAALHNYLEKDYWQDHQLIYFDTLYEYHVYEIFAVFKTSANMGAGFRYHINVDFANEAEFNDHVSQCKSLAFYDTGITPVYGDKLICLSTCEYTLDNGRLVVCARRVF